MKVLPAPTSRLLRSQLKSAILSVGWTYGLYWHFCPQEGILKWGDGYYNGAIQTRRIVQSKEIEGSFERGQQLGELYESLSVENTNRPKKRARGALSPEDLTETEWFYLMCKSYSFLPGVGAPGKAYERKEHVWLTNANELDTSRSILARSSKIQTIVCVPLLEGAVEFGTTKQVKEDLSFIREVKSFFSDHMQMTQYDQPPTSAIYVEEEEMAEPEFSSKTELTATELTQEDSDCSRTTTVTLTTMFKCQSTSNPAYVSSPNQSSFTKWTDSIKHQVHIIPGRVEYTSQSLLKCILFTVPFLHPNSTKPDTPSDSTHADMVDHRNPTQDSQENLSASNDKLKEPPLLVPWVQKTEMARSKNVTVEVSIVESDALLEIECGYRERLLLDVMQVLRDLKIEAVTVQSTANEGVFEAKIWAKVKVNENRKKRCIAEVKRALKLIAYTGFK